jgi:CHAD domain-containing protein
MAAIRMCYGGVTESVVSMAHATTGIPRGLARALRGEIDALSREIGRARRGEKDGVHKARVASRRLREYLPLVSALAGVSHRSLERDVRRVTRALGGVREMDVAREVLRDAGSSTRWRPGDIARVDRVAEMTRRRREKAMIKALDALDTDDLIARLGDVIVMTGAPSRRRAPGPLIIARVRQRAAALVRALDAAGTLYAVEPLHSVRIAAKKLRYALELAKPAARIAAAREIRIIRDVQIRLGAIHDVQVLQDRVQAAASEDGLDRATTRQLVEFDQFLEKRCRELHAKFLKPAARARALAERLPADLALRLVERRRARMARMTAAPAMPEAAGGSR